MGWSSGTVLFEQIIESAKKYIPDETNRKKFYAEVYKPFCDADWDTEDECFEQDPLFEEVYNELINEI